MTLLISLLALNYYLINFNNMVHQIITWFINLKEVYAFLRYPLFESYAGCPYSCVTRAPNAFTFGSTGTARATSQGWLLISIMFLYLEDYNSYQKSELE